jgi:hypothetical protein
MSRDEEKFVNGIKQQLDEQIDGMDGHTLSRLRQARAAALTESTERTWRWQPLAALASVTALAVAVWLAMPVDNGSEHNMAALDDMELLASADDLEFYENIEFYEWVESQDEQG